MPVILEDILPCALANACFSLLPSDEEIAAIPSESEIESCADVEAGLCPVTTRCPPCKEVADEFFKCIIVGNSEDGALSQNVTDLVLGCSLECDDFGEEIPSSEAPVVAPVEEVIADTEAPVEAPVEEEEDASDISEAPVEAPVEEGEAEVADGSGAMSANRMASGVTILIGFVSIIL